MNMLSKEQIAHDLAVAWAQAAVEGKVPAKTQNKSMVEEYLSAYNEALDKLNHIDQS